MVRLAILTILVALAAPSAASAADVFVDNGVLRYTATPGKTSNVTFLESGAGTVQISTGSGDNDGLTPIAPNCLAGTPVTCTGVTSAAIDAGDQNDRVTAGFQDTVGAFFGLMNIPVIISGGDGNDAITPNTGADAISGGDGTDTVLYGLRASPVFSLDGQANDGEADEGDLIGADVENITARAASGVATLTGDGRANRLTVTDGRGDITGGDGADVLEGGPLDDTFHARDGTPDTVLCNGGTDTVEADTVDTVSPSCEVVSTVATPGGAFDDRPPLLAWAAPTANASLSANTPSKLSINASDDRGLARVQFYDDDRLLCEVTAPPFDCSYVPRGGDVGRNTLIAVAVDGANQTTSAVRAVTGRRFSPSALTHQLRPSRDPTAPYSYRATGTLSRPTVVSPTQGCSGTITITAKKGAKTVATHRSSLRRTCEFVTTVRFRSKLSSKLRLIAKFGGNDVLSARSAPSRTVTLG